MDAKKERKKRKKYKELYLREYNARKHVEDEADYLRDEVKTIRTTLASYFEEMVAPVLKAADSSSMLTLDPLRYEMLASFLSSNSRIVDGGTLRFGGVYNLFWRHIQIFRGQR